MSSEQTFSTHDLRSGAKEFGRDKNHRTKWAHGESYGPGRRLEDARPRPARVIPTPKVTGGFNKARTAMKNDMADAGSDSSADESIDEPSAAPAPDAGIAYSYDAERGPNEGSQVLGQALAKAIERFEVRQTDKLIRDEYEVLDAGALSPAPRPGKKGILGVEDEDYEFVDA